MKTFLITAFLVLCILISQGQIGFGIKAGYNNSTLYLSGANFTSNQKSKSGFNAGVFASIPIFNSFELQPEISYSEQGSQSKDSSAKDNYNYLNIPVLLKYFHKTGIFLNTGPQIGFLLSSKYKSENTSQDLKSISKSVDFSWAIGAGYLIKKINLTLEVRYNYGFTNVFDYDVISSKNRVLQVDLLYTFR